MSRIRYVFPMLPTFEVNIVWYRWWLSDMSGACSLLPWRKRQNHPVHKLTSASRRHRLPFPFLLLALFTLYTWASMQVKLQHSVAWLQDEYIFSPAGCRGGYARSRKKNQHFSRDVSCACSHTQVWACDGAAALSTRHWQKKPRPQSAGCQR